MKRKRRHLSPQFKARIALEALQEQSTTAEIAKKNDIAPTQVSEWKCQLESRMSELFERKNAVNENLLKAEKSTQMLERKVGQLVLEKDFLVKKCEQLGIDLSEKP